MTKIIKNFNNSVNNYRYIVSINSKPYAQLSKFPKTHIETGIRFNKLIYENGELKKIIYPNDILFMYITKDDCIERNIIKLQNEWPNWNTIKVELIDNINDD